MDDIHPAFNPARNDAVETAGHFGLSEPRGYAASNLSNCLGFSSLSVCTPWASRPYIWRAGNPLRAAFCSFLNPWVGMSRSRTIRWTLLVVAMAALGYWGWQRFHGENHPTQADAQKPAAARSAVPVKIASVERADFPIYLTGLGTVQGFNTVVVRTRVDGQIDRIAFKEGELVEKNDLLALVDPRPYQAALDQAKAKKAQDEANLANAELDLQRYTKLGEFATRKQTDTQRSMVQQLNAQIAADEAAIANAQTQLDYTGIRAPIAGVTGFRLVDRGNIVNASTQT